MNFLSINIRGVRESGKAAWIRRMKSAHGINFIAVQELQLADASNVRFQSFWGRSRFEVEFSNATGRSGGMASLWDPTMLVKQQVTKARHYLAVFGVLSHLNCPILIINIYAPQETRAKKALWDELTLHIGNFSGLVILLGDFNAVRFPSDRLNSKFCSSSAGDLNNFIHQNGLVEYNIGGHKVHVFMGEGGKT